MKRRNRGYAIAISLAVLMLLFTLAVALNYWSGMARSGALLSEAQFQAEQELYDQMALDQARFQGGNAAGSGPSGDISLRTSSSHHGQLRQASGSRLFTDVPAADFTEGDADESRGWHESIEYQPYSLRGELNSFRRKRYRTVYSSSFPYGAFAPKGEVKLEKALPWGNPPEEVSRQETQKPEDFASSTKVLLGAESGVEVSRKMAYGEVYVRDRQGTVDVNGEGALIFRGRLPMGNSYAPRLLQQLDGALNMLTSNARDGDKSQFIFAEALLSPKGVLNALLSLGNVSPDQLLTAFTSPSLNQGMKFTMVAVPSVSIGVVYNELTPSPSLPSRPGSLLRYPEPGQLTRSQASAAAAAAYPGTEPGSRPAQHAPSGFRPEASRRARQRYRTSTERSEPSPPGGPTTAAQL